MKDDKGTKESKQVNFRIDPDSAEAFRLFCTSNGMNQAQGFDHLMQVLELNNAKTAVPGRVAEIENFERLTKELLSAYINSVELGSHAEECAKEQFRYDLKRKDRTIDELREKIEALETQKKDILTALSSSEEEGKRLKEQFEHLYTQMEAAKKAASTSKSNSSSNTSSASGSQSSNTGASNATTETTIVPEENTTVDETYEEETTTSSGSTSSASGDAVVSYASQFIGNPYVYGGNSLTGGIDCSGFTQQIMAKFGYSISRTSSSQAGDGRAVSTSNLRAGDLVFYGDGGGINHVALYIGGGQVVHASNSAPYPRGGIKISNVNYRTPICARRIIG